MANMNGTVFVWLLGTSLSLWLWLTTLGLVLAGDHVAPPDVSSPSSGMAVVPGQGVKDGGKPTDFSAETAAGSTAERFVPTEQWQNVKPGQHIPAGLHVRLNLATGEKEAKLLDPSGSDESTQQQEQLSRSEVERALKDLRTSHSDDPGPEQSSKASTTDQPKSAFRSYDELKEEYAKMGMAVKTDGQIMKDLLKSYNDPKTSLDKQLAVLEDLEYLAHQLDNALDFVKLGGLSLCIGALNTSLHPTAAVPVDQAAVMRHTRVAHLLGSAVQSNPPVQIAAVEQGALVVLLRNLAAASVHHDHNPNLVISDHPELVVDDLVPLQHKLVYALTCTVRAFPFAQQQFIKLGGLDVMHSIVSDSAGNAKLRLKLITLLYDLLHEAAISAEHDEDVERRQQYSSIDWPALLDQHNVCSLLRHKYLDEIIRKASLPNFPHVNFIDKVLDLLSIVWQTVDVDQSNCRQLERRQFDQLQLLANRWQTVDAELVGDDDLAEFQRDVSEKLQLILTLSSPKSSSDEL